MLEALLEGAPEWGLESCTKAGLRQLTITINEDSAVLNLLVRYGSSWPQLPNEKVAIGLQKASSHLLPVQWKLLLRNVPETATTIVEEGTDPESFVWSLAERVRPLMADLLKSQRMNLHDKMTEATLSPVLDIPPSFSNTSLDSPKGNPELQERLNKIRAKQSKPRTAIMPPVAASEKAEPQTQQIPKEIKNDKIETEPEEDDEDEETAASSSREQASESESECDDESSDSFRSSGSRVSASTTSDSSSDSDSSSSCMKFGDAWDRRQVEEMKKSRESEETLSFPETPNKSGKKLTVVTLKPEEIRQQLMLRHLMSAGNEDDREVRDAALDMMVQNGILDRGVPEDPGLIKVLDELLKDGEKNCVPTRSIVQSWYKQHFKPIKALGKGGQGRVEQVQNLLDGLYYAVKRVPLPSLKSGQKDDMAERYVRAEVRTLARLRHPYIVRYFIAWFEQEIVPDGETLLDQEASGHNSYMMSSFGDSDEVATVTEGAQVKRFCYIQMEYCYQETLRQAIDRGIFLLDESSLESGFKIVWQLLECVEYIHKQNVIHRDLKPENIFFDIVSTTGHKYFAGDIKVGDFGLATGDASEDQNSADDTHPDRTTTPGKEHSTGIGTPLYCAPEQERRCDYNSKVDEYSLGIITYEMFGGFKSTHERHLAITSLRKTGKVPADWRGRNIRSANLAELIESLATLDPDRRATAKEILDRGLLPKPRHQEDMQAAVVLFNNYQETMIKLLYEKCLSDPNALNSLDWLHQLKELKIHDDPPPVLISAHGECWAKELIVDSFRRLGATELKVPLQIPANSIIKDHECVKHMDEAGRVMVRPVNPAVAYARYLAILHPVELLVPMRRYAIGNGVVDNKVCRLASFDIATPEGEAETHGVNTEMLLLLGGVLDQLSIPSEQMWVVHVNHTDLLSILMSVCGLDRPEEVSKRASHKGQTPENFSRPLNIDEKIGRKIIELHGTKKTFGLRTNPTNIFTHVASTLGVKSLFHECAKNSNSLEAARRDKGGVLEKASLAVKHKAATALCTLQKLENALVELKFREKYPNVKVEFDISLTRDCRVYSGLMYSVEMCEKTEKPKGVPSGSSKPPVGAGGRYGALFKKMRRHYQSLAASDKEELLGQKVFQVPGNVSVCGIYLNITEITRQCWEGKRERKKVPGMGAVVHVCMKPSGYDSNVLLRVATELRENGIQADFQLEPGVQIATLQDTCRKNLIPWMLLLPGVSSSKQTNGDLVLQCKLKNLNTGVLRKEKNDTQKEDIIEARISQIGNLVAYRLSGRTVGAPSAQAAPLHEAPAGLKVYTYEGKVHSDSSTVHGVLELANKVFGAQLPSKDCVSVDIPISTVREITATLCGWQVHHSFEGGKYRPITEVIRQMAATVPTVLIHSVPDEKFEVVVSANIRSASEEHQGTASRSDKHGKRRDERKKGRKERVLY